MVNPGHASMGCISCKLRKVQCDLTRPLCRRCMDSGRVCLGFGESEADQQAYQSRQIKSSVEAVSLFEVLFGNENGQSNPRYISALQDSDGVAFNVISTIRKCLYSLRQPFQSQGERKALLSEYATATSNLRATLHLSPSSPALGCAIYLFSVYEMIVNIDTEDRTWQIHLEALLQTFSQPLSEISAPFTADASTLRIAIHIYEHKNAFQEISQCDIPSLEKVFLILDFTMLCLRSLESKIKVLLDSTPRKIDVQKLRASVKQLQTNLRLFPKICPTGDLITTDVSSTNISANALLLIRWNDYHCLQLIIADLLMTTGSFVASRDYEESREYDILSTTTKEAVEGICSTVPTILKMESIQKVKGPKKLIESSPWSLFVLWHLCCALKTTKITEPRHHWIQERLWSIGSQAFIPRASALAASETRTMTWTEVLAGLLLVRVSLSEDLVEIFSQGMAC